jgi:pyridoxine 5'-phosphate synthase PdxJ
MVRRAAILTQADVARAIRAAKQAGATTVEVHPDGRIIVRMDAPLIAPDLTSHFEIEPDPGIVL